MFPEKIVIIWRARGGRRGVGVGESGRVAIASSAKLTLWFFAKRSMNPGDLFINNRKQFILIVPKVRLKGVSCLHVLVG